MNIKFLAIRQSRQKAFYILSSVIYLSIFLICTEIEWGLNILICSFMKFSTNNLKSNIFLIDYFDKILINCKQTQKNLKVLNKVLQKELQLIYKSIDISNLPHML